MIVDKIRKEQKQLGHGAQGFQQLANRMQKL